MEVQVNKGEISIDINVILLIGIFLIVKVDFF